MTMEKHDLLINGKWAPAKSGETFVVHNPARTEVIAEVAKADPEDVAEAASCARQAFEDGPWPRMQASERARILYRLADLIRDHLEEIARVTTENFCRLFKVELASRFG